MEAAGDSLLVRVDLANRGDAKTGAVTVEGELLGRRDEARLERGIAPGETGSALLRYPLDVPRPGVHPLLLLLGYTRPGGVTMSQRAYMLLSLGANPPPAVKLAVPEAALLDQATLRVGLESADGAPHRVRLSVATPKGLNGEAPPLSMDVPASGRVTALLRLLRGSVPRDTVQGILVVAGASDGPFERTTVESGVVRVLPDPAWMPRLRRPLLFLALLLVAGAVAAEIWRARVGP